MTITLPDGVQSRMETAAHAAGFDSVEQYLLFLFLRDQADLADNGLDPCGIPSPELTYCNPEELHAKLLEGLNSGAPIPVTPEFWEERRRVLAERRAVRERKDTGA